MKPRLPVFWTEMTRELTLFPRDQKHSDRTPSLFLVQTEKVRRSVGVPH